MGYKGRDVEIIPIDASKYLVMACDSCGAVGSKEFDKVKAEPYLVGRLTARVVLMEVISTGAKPVMISAAIVNELSPTGEGVLEGIKDELIGMGIDNLPMAVSTEKNFETKQTGIGISVVGLCEKEKLHVGIYKPGDKIYCVGVPKVGDEIEGCYGGDLAQGKHVMELLELEGVHDIIPVGSRGILAEAQDMAESANCRLQINNTVLNINKSAGPSTCFIFSCDPSCNISLADKVPLNEIGRLF